ncbi:MAG: hypothetical protein ABJB98_10000 [Actinomycetota bacterium]
MILCPPHLDLPGDPTMAALFCLASSAPAGDAEIIRATARAFAQTADELQAALRHLGTVARDTSHWTGDAATAFRTAINAPTALHLDEVPDRYRAYARVLTAYAGQLEQAQVALSPARARVEDAVRAYQAVHAAASGQPGALDAARQECGASARAFAAEFDAWADAATRCVHGLRTIDRSDHLHNPHGWHALVDAASTVMGDVSTMTGVLGILALAICPPAAAVLLAVSAASSGVAVAADLDRAYGFGEDVALTTLASDALGVVPMGAAATATKAGVRAARRATRAAGASASGLARAAFAAEWKQSMITAPRAAITSMRTGHVALSKPALGPTLTRFGQNPDALAGFGASSGIDTYENRREGLVRAGVRSPFRVVWKPISDAIR